MLLVCGGAFLGLQVNILITSIVVIIIIAQPV